MVALNWLVFFRLAMRPLPTSLTVPSNEHLFFTFGKRQSKQELFGVRHGSVLWLRVMFDVRV